MYRITNANTGETVGYAESVTYIKKKGNTYVNATADEAHGVAYQGVAYSLFGKKEIDAETVLLIKMDAGAAISEARAAAADNSAVIDSILGL